MSNLLMIRATWWSPGLAGAGMVETPLSEQATDIVDSEVFWFVDNS